MLWLTNPILISDDTEIIAGHGRVEAAKAALVLQEAGAMAGKSLWVGIDVGADEMSFWATDGDGTVNLNSLA